MTSLLTDCTDHDVLRIHPRSPIRAWTWEQSFEQARADAQDPTDIAEPQRGDVDLLLVHWYAPFGDAGPAATRELNAYLVTRLQPTHLRGSRRRELLDFCTELIQHEAIHDFEIRLQQADLPRLSDAQHHHLTEVMRALAGYLTLAQCSTLSSRAIRGAGDGLSARRRESHPRWASFAIAWLEEVIAHPFAYDLDGVPPAPANDDGTSWVTKMIFELMCGIDPWHASVAEVAANIPAKLDQQDDLIDIEFDMTDAVRLLLDQQLRIDPHAAYRALERAQEETFGSTRAAIGQLIELINTYRAAGGTLREALAAAMSATILLPGNRDGTFGPTVIAGRVRGIMYAAALDSMLGVPAWRHSQGSSADGQDSDTQGPLRHDRRADTVG